MSNILLELIHQVLGNVVRTYNANKTYVDADDQRSVILTVAAFSIFMTENLLKDYIPVQFKFGYNIIFPVNILWIRNKYVSKSKRKFTKI